MAKWPRIAPTLMGKEGWDASPDAEGRGFPIVVEDSESAPSSPASEDLTSASNEQDTGSSSSANLTPTEDESSNGTGQESRASRMFVQSATETGEGWWTEDVPRVWEGGIDKQLIFSAEDSRAKTSQSPADEQDSSTESDLTSSSSSPESLTLFSPMGDGSSLRTYPDFFPPTVDEISQSYSRRWPNSGFTTSPGECWTADTSECPSEGAASSSLPDVLEADVHPRFYLSPRAAAGILRRAEKRGKPLPEALRTALLQLAHSKEALAEETTKKPDTDPSSPAPSEAAQESGGGAQTQTVRRLSPTECERLQGFPDGHTVIP